MIQGDPSVFNKVVTMCTPQPKGVFTERWSIGVLEQWGVGLDCHVSGSCEPGQKALAGNIVAGSFVYLDAATRG